MEVTTRASNAIMAHDRPVTPTIALYGSYAPQITAPNLSTPLLAHRLPLSQVPLLVGSSGGLKFRGLDVLFSGPARYMDTGLLSRYQLVTEPGPEAHFYAPTLDAVALAINASNNT